MVIGIVAMCLMENKTDEVTFDTDGGSSVPMQIVKKGEKVIKPTDPLKDDYVFVRWELDGKEYDFDSSVVNNILLKAIWGKVELPKYKLTFNVDGKIKEIEVASIDEIDLSMLGFEEKNGMEIIWELDGKEFDFQTPLTEDIILTGKYVKVTTLTVTFNSNGGSKVENQKIKSGEKVVEPTNPTRYGYLFDGWYLNNTKYDFDTAVTKNITLTAKWNEDPSIKRYEVKFDSDGGSSVTSQRVIENEKATTPKVPTKKDYKFVEWQLDNKKYNFNDKVTKNITLKAIWRELETYTITFNNDDGNIYITSKVKEDSTVTQPANPTKSGYTFKEWQLDGKKFDFKTKITKDMTLNAVYTKDSIKYTVTFDSGVASQIVGEGEKVTKPANPTKSGYNFIEWQLDGNEYDFNTPVTRNISLTALFEKILVSDKYKVVVTIVDNYSPDRILKAYKNNEEITVSEIKYTDGVHLCNGSKLVVAYNDIKDEKSLIIVLSDGKEVTAVIE